MDVFQNGTRSMIGSLLFEFLLLFHFDDGGGGGRRRWRRRRRRLLLRRRHRRRRWRRQRQRQVQVNESRRRRSVRRRRRDVENARPSLKIQSKSVFKKNCFDQFGRADGIPAGIPIGAVVFFFNAVFTSPTTRLATEFIDFVLSDSASDFGFNDLTARRSFFCCF